MRRNRWSPIRFGDPRKRKAAREAAKEPADLPRPAEIDTKTPQIADK